MDDFRFAFRQLLKNPGFTAVAVITLALGIGANTAIFSVIDAALLRPLPFPDAGGLLWIEEVSRGDTQEPWGAHFLEWREHSQTLEQIAAYDGSTRTLIGSGEPERVEVGKASANLLPLFGAEPAAPGRSFSSAEDKPGGDQVAILSHSLWQRRYGEAQDIVGRSITLNDASFTVIGVLPESFHFFQPFDVWVPLALDRQRELTSDTHYYGPTVARLKPGVSLDAARAELDTLLQRYEAARPDGKPRFANFRTQIVPLRDHLLGDTRRPLLVLVGAVALVLLIACANVANLLLARAVTRQKEMAIRAALGAGRLRLIRQLLTECLMLAASGGAIGLLLAYWLSHLFGSFGLADALGQMAHVAAIAADLRVSGFALLVSLLTGVFFGLLPMVRLSRPDLNDMLRQGGRGGKSHGRTLRCALMVGEIALAIVLLVGAGLLIRSFAKLIGVEPGYQPEKLLTAQLRLPPRYDGESKRAQFYDQLLHRAAALPGIVSVGATSQLPLTRYNMGGTLRVKDVNEASGKREIGAPITAVSSDYFHTMGITLRNGRHFNEGDALGAPSVVVLSETLAQKLFPGEDPVGKQIFVAGSGSELTTVIGVVGGIRHQGLDQAIEQAAYLNYRQLPRPMMSLVLRTQVPPSSLAPSLRAAVREIDPALPVFDVMTMDERLSHSVAGRRFCLLLLGSFAALASALAGLGVYGVIAYLVTERTHEVGIRMALGAGRGEIVALVLRQGMLLAGTGVALGLVVAIGFTRVLNSLLFEVKPGDPVTLVTVASILLTVSLVASWLPARRASRVDPMVALRSD